MNRSIRCVHGMDRSLVACPACGDTDADSRREDKVNARRNPRKVVMNRPHGGSCRRDRLAYARRERQAGR
jgi:hypothetical protein